MPPTTPPLVLWDPQLSDREIYFIGTIAVHWASMEHEVFMQTLSSFDIGDANTEVQLPKEMNNIQFTGVLALWKERVLPKARGRRAKALSSQYEKIVSLKDFRDALTHGMWHWSPEDLGSISNVRVKKRQVITTKFSVADLEDFSKQIAEVNFYLRHPGGLSDLARARAREGFHINRRAISMFVDVPVDNQGYPVGAAVKKNSKAESDA